MIPKRESDLRKQLSIIPRDKLIDLFIKLKKINEAYCDRIDKLEEQIDELITLDELIEDLS